VVIVNLKLIAEARGAAERFLHRVKDYETSKYVTTIGEEVYASYGAKETSALRKSSMYLAADLAQLILDLARMRSYKV
jgi:glutamate synthase domain-containing protein 2